MVRYRGRMFSPCRLDVPNMAGRAAEILETEKRRSEELEKADYSQLEFKPVDANPSPRKQIRVGEILKDVSPGTMRSSGRSLELDSLEFEDKLMPHQGNLHLFQQERGNNVAADAEMLETEEELLAGNGDQLDNVPVDDDIAVDPAAAGEMEEEAQVHQHTPDPGPLNQFKDYIDKARKNFH